LLVLSANCAKTKEVEPKPPECRHTFDLFPDGTPIEGDTGTSTGAYQSLDGDEFSDWGFLVASAPVTNCVVVKTSYYSTTNNYLMLLEGNPCSGANRIEVTFLDPVGQVSLAFSGASIDYMMEVYDQAGELLGVPTQTAEFDEEGQLFTVSFVSDSANIKRIRFGYVGTTVAVVAIREISTCDIVSYSAPDWFTDRGNLGHTASTNSQIALPLSERWRVNLSGGIRSSVIGAFGKLYIGTDGNTMYALSPQDGSEQWAFQANAKLSSPATAVVENKQDKYLWFVAEDGSLYALNAESGDLLWKVSGGVGTFNSATNYASGIVFYNYMSGGVSSKVRAVNGISGAIAWESSEYNITTATPMHGAGRLFQGLAQGGTVFRAYHPMTGDVDWEVYESGPTAASYTSGVIDSDTGVGNPIRIYFSSRNGSVKAIESANGQAIWETNLPGSGQVWGLALTQDRSPNTLIVAQNADLYALEPPTGNIVWRIQHSGNHIDPTTRNTPKPAIYGDYVFGVEAGSDLVARKLGDGTEAWRVTLDAHTASSPTVGGETVYIATSTGTVYAFSP
jgi:outer membrane protein assembly factor BamB